ncbi:MAG TPA: hypothetical protein VEU98_00335 [Candidatus Eremiobacteraceae bacterium]|nr:hypothetical protein [Candidatus Eremiobacteraceae bacterium]
MDLSRRISIRCIALLAACVVSCPALCAQSPACTSQKNGCVATLIATLKTKSKSLESSASLHRDFDVFLANHKLATGSVSYSDFVLIHLVFEATRDAGLWNMHWSVTDKPPNSDEIWRQWKRITRPSYSEKTATAECDELSALFAFFVERAGVKSVGLFWPYSNHTVAVWTVRPANSPEIRVVVPTSQIFLTENDTFDTHGFDPWHQKTIYEYTRKDVPDSFEIPQPLFAFFLSQIDKYGGASTETLQQLRNLRGAVFEQRLTPDQAAKEALRRSTAYASSEEDRAAFRHFAEDLSSTSEH